MSVSIKCQTECKLLKLSYEKLKEVIDKYENEAFGKSLLLYQNKLLKKAQKIPCDYIVRLPKYYNADEKAIRRNNTFKNVVMRIILDIREI